jgi:hypothetical protein
MQIKFLQNRHRYQLMKFFRWCRFFIVIVDCKKMEAIPLNKKHQPSTLLAMLE